MSTSAAVPPRMYTPACSSSVHTTARMPPRHVYSTVSAPSTRIAATMEERSLPANAGPMISATGIAVANTRTESAIARVTMNTMDVKRRVATPKRVSSSVYAVTSSPW